MSAPDALRHQSGLTREVVRLALEGLSHDDTLLQPPAGNCANWVLGHMIAVYEEIVPLVGGARVRPAGAFARYARGSAPITGPGEGMPLDELRTAWGDACTAFDGALAALPEARLSETVADSPDGSGEGTIASLLSTISFHQAYHAGQIGLLRRLAGRPGPIA